MCVLVCVRVYDSTYRDEINSTLLCDVILVTPNNQLV